jgi:hypothetical protein
MGRLLMVMGLLDLLMAMVGRHALYPGEMLRLQLLRPSNALHR